MHDVPLAEVEDRFIRLWGQMAGAWGISRTMGEAHALLYITGEALCTDDIMERLEISRGNASMSLRALVEWGIVSRIHKKGDRKEYFLAEQDLWSMFRAIVRERLRREVEPMLAALHELRDLVPERSASLAAGARPEAPTQADRLDAMLSFFQLLEAFAHRFVTPQGEGLQAAASLLVPGGPRERNGDA